MNQAVLESDCSFIVTLPALDVVFHSDLLLVLVLLMNRCLTLSVVLRCAFLCAVRKLHKIRPFLLCSVFLEPRIVSGMWRALSNMLNEVTTYA